jgi:hypothetical protein
MARLLTITSTLVIDRQRGDVGGVRFDAVGDVLQFGVDQVADGESSVWSACQKSTPNIIGPCGDQRPRSVQQTIANDSRAARGQSQAVVGGPF